MKSPDFPMMEDTGGSSLRDEIEELFGEVGRPGGSLKAKKPIRIGDTERHPTTGEVITTGAANTTASDAPLTWKPGKGDKPGKDGSLTLSEVIDYAKAQHKKWSKELTKAKQWIDDPLDETKKPINLEPVQALGLLTEQARHFVDLLRRLKPEKGIPSSDPTAKAVLNKLLCSIPSGAKVISTAGAVRILVPAFPDLFDGAASLKAAGKRLQGLLRGLGVSNRDIRINGQVVKGYRVADLRQAAV
jgi:hypothetical protein